jgi:hypothetical protein
MGVGRGGGAQERPAVSQAVCLSACAPAQRRRRPHSAPPAAAPTARRPARPAPGPATGWLLPAVAACASSPRPRPPHSPTRARAVWCQAWACELEVDESPPAGGRGHGRANPAHARARSGRGHARRHMCPRRLQIWRYGAHAPCAHADSGRGRGWRLTLQPPRPRVRRGGASLPCAPSFSAY